MEKMLLIKFESNYADEYDIEGFEVMAASEWEAHKEAVIKAFENKAQRPLPEPDKQYSWRNDEVRRIEIYFGTNEAMLYENVEQYFSEFTVSEITDNDLEVLLRLFGNYANKVHYGIVPMIDNHTIDRIMKGIE